MVATAVLRGCSALVTVTVPRQRDAEPIQNLYPPRDVIVPWLDPLSLCWTQITPGGCPYRGRRQEDMAPCSHKCPQVTHREGTATAGGSGAEGKHRASHKPHKSSPEGGGTTRGAFARPPALLAITCCPPRALPCSRDRAQPPQGHTHRSHHRSSGGLRMQPPFPRRAMEPGKCPRLG